MYIYIYTLSRISKHYDILITGNQLYKQPNHRQPVSQAVQAQAISYTCLSTYSQ